MLLFLLLVQLGQFLGLRAALKEAGRTRQIYVGESAKSEIKDITASQLPPGLCWLKEDRSMQHFLGVTAKAVMDTLEMEGVFRSFRSLCFALVLACSDDSRGKPFSCSMPWNALVQPKAS
jgi:hypothetical protein